MKLTLFWQFFITTLATVVFTVIISLFAERWLTERAVTTHMEARIEQLTRIQNSIMADLQDGNPQAIERLYQQQPDLVGQISIIDAQGQIRYPDQAQLRTQRKNELTAFPVGDDDPRRHWLDMIGSWQDSFAPPATAITTADGDKLFVQITPRLSIQELLQARRGTFGVRFVLLLLLSAAICYAPSRSLSNRIRRLQRNVHQIGSGQYQAATTTPQRKHDELAALDHDIAALGQRLQDSENARNQMLSDISHELRSPLARMQVATELTRDQAPQATAYLDRIQHDIQRMNTLIADIITIQSLQHNSSTILDSENCDIDALIDSIGVDVCFEFQHKHINWTHQRAGQATLIGDKPRLHSALENIIRNAFMHTAAGGAVSAVVTNHGDNLHIDISDSGNGITSAADCERIFQPFVRLDNTRQRKTGGHGLGLAIAKAIIEAHQGSISAQNRSDGMRGLHIAIVLPLQPVSSFE
ncbi:hypothetical protein KRX19_02540 [Cardiobacteriaceae bacterium TAE3-ERU3]|nr:hypothetical protein [Cardiobacteriaceae bacterium TAE3-ERU3]